MPGDFPTIPRPILLKKPTNPVQSIGLPDIPRLTRKKSSYILPGIIEFSNYCVRNCLYCGLRRDNRLLTRYRIAPEEILAAARQARDEGYWRIMLQSGEDPAYTVDVLAGLVQRIKEKLDMAVTLSLGDHSRDDYRRLRDVGANRYLLKHETADPALFARLRPGTTLERRLLT
ncbi:radical SAM protein [Desulforudis sp. DRI-14]|uniref:radical SAM protein n=1 Tax=Desulforudis sp. DRI-14 TaxID=3459793 RepID=UPI0040423E89